MEAGKVAISEKPVTLCTADLEEMIAASKRTGSVFTVHQNRRWDEDFRVAEKDCKSGQLGRVFAIQSRVHGSRGIRATGEIRRHRAAAWFLTGACTSLTR